MTATVADAIAMAKGVDLIPSQRRSGASGIQSK